MPALHLVPVGRFSENDGHMKIAAVSNSVAVFTGLEDCLLVVPHVNLGRGDLRRAATAIIPIMGGEELSDNGVYSCSFSNDRTFFHLAKVANAIVIMRVTTEKDDFSGPFKQQQVAELYVLRPIHFHVLAVLPNDIGYPDELNLTVFTREPSHSAVFTDRFQHVRIINERWGRQTLGTQTPNYVKYTSPLLPEIRLMQTLQSAEDPLYRELNDQCPINYFPAKCDGILLFIPHPNRDRFIMQSNGVELASFDCNDCDLFPPFSMARSRKLHAITFGNQIYLVYRSMASLEIMAFAQCYKMLNRERRKAIHEKQAYDFHSFLATIIM